jgi:hypothetical protein
VDIVAIGLMLISTLLSLGAIIPQFGSREGIKASIPAPWD